MDKFKEKSIILEVASNEMEHLKSSYKFYNDEYNDYLCRNSEQNNDNEYLREQSEICKVKAQAYEQIMELLEKLL